MPTIIAFIIVLGVLVLVHELGHFIVAKLAGIAVPRFSIGLGPRVWGVKIGETEYVISALPLGGYVKMVGMGEEAAMERIEGGPAEDEDVPPERRFDSKSVPIRVAVICAGVVMNFAFAIVAFAALAYAQGTYLPVIGSVMPDGPAAAAGIEPGDTIVAVDGQPMGRWVDFAQYVQVRPGDTLQIRVARGGQDLQLRTGVERMVQRDTIANDSLVYGRIGVVLDTLQARQSIGAGTALWTGTRHSVELSGVILSFLGRLITGRASARELGGPILIGQLSGQAARAGLLPFITFMAILSVHLAILNLLPIPILDGGHLLFLGIEVVRGRALSLEARMRLSQIGFILILALMVWVVTSDLLRITGR